MAYPSLPEAITAFEATLVAKSPATANTYRSALRRFVEFLADQPHAHTGEFGPDILDQLYIWLLDNYGREHKSTALSYVAAARAFFRFLERRRWLNPDVSYERMKDNLRELIGRVHYKTPRVDDAVALLVAAAQEAPLPPDGADHRQGRLCLFRDRALICTLFSTGCRRAEAARLNRQDVQDGHAPQALITGKGGKERVVFFDEDALAAIREYLAARNDQYAPLFLRHDDGRGKPARRGETWRLSPKGVWSVVKEYATLAGVPATTHHLRHLKARVMLNNGAQLAEVQDILGHASPETTKRIYAPYTTQHLREANDRFSVRAEDMAKRLRTRRQ